MSKEIATKKKETELSPITNTATAFGGMVNAEQDDFSLDRLALIQGTAMETEMYGDHKRGTWVSTATGEEFNVKERKFIPIMGYNEWIKYAEGGAGSGIEYRTMNKDDVPAEDLVWGTGKKGVGYSAIKHINWVVLFEDSEIPVILSFKKTSLKSGQAIMRMEASRQAKCARDGVTPTPNAYFLDQRDKKFSEGSALLPVARPAGDASIDLLESGISWFNRLGDPSQVASRVNHKDDDVAPF